MLVFFCFGSISILPDSMSLAHVDHFFPHVLQKNHTLENLDGVWNLVLACAVCNGASEKGAKVPSIGLVERLYKRNEYYVGSNHPLKETILLQTGKSDKLRHDFLQEQYNQAKSSLLHEWAPEAKNNSIF
ncbi:MAG TPA: hypothetical protein EYQ50_09105 [Verrucomicrobiales bacterium]|nr:hypothetical protein [Verrucomicrobiales bacterium]